ncbi:MAG: SPL family radical SAM protein [Gammaproteobacteria bacterium]
MIETLYIEEQAQRHPRTQAIVGKFPQAKIVECRHYGEIFNRAGQNFRLQKSRPALILALKGQRRVLPVPAGFELGSGPAHYFSHMLNCLYDCRYCFLQGMFRSAHYVLFVNYEDFMRDILELARDTTSPQWFFSGYDCDSLALDPVTEFAEHAITALEPAENVWLELRTKSTQIRSLLRRPPMPRVVCAFSLNPEPIIKLYEHDTPTLARRIAALRRLAAHGWQIALRFDPLFLTRTFKADYQRLFEQIRAGLGLYLQQIHSITLGCYRLPTSYAQRMERLFPDEKLFAQSLPEHDGLVGYPAGVSAAMLEWSEQSLRRLGFTAPVYIQSA